MEPINLSPYEDVDQPPIDLGNTPIAAPSTPEEADERTKKISFALPQANPDQIKSELLQGNEKAMRESVAAELSLRKEEFVNQLIKSRVREKGGPITPQEHAELMTLVASSQVPVDWDSVFEEQYADQYIKQARYFHETDEESFVKDVPSPIVKQAEEVSYDLISKDQYLETRGRESYEILKGQSWGGYLVDFAKMITPYPEIKLRGLVPGVPYLEGLGLGSNLQAQMQALYAKPLPEFKRIVNEILSKLEVDNPQAAVEFIQAMRGYSSSEENFKNFFTAIELTAVQPAFRGLKGVGRAIRDWNDVRQAHKDVVKAAAKSPESPRVSAKEAIGDAEGAAVSKGAEIVEARVKGGYTPQREAMDKLPTAMRIDATQVAEAPSRLHRELVTRIANYTEHFSGQVMQVLENVLKVARTPSILETEAVVRAIKDNLRDLYPRTNILDIAKPIHNGLTNTYDIAIDIGAPGAKLFRTKEIAQTYAKNAGYINPSFERQGVGYFIRLHKPLRETDDIIRDALITTGNSKAPTTWTSSWMNFIRTPEETLSPEHRMNRKVATYAQSALLQLANREAKYIRDIARGLIRFDEATGQRIPWYQVQARGLVGTVTRQNRHRWDELERVLEKGKDELGDDGLPGRWYNSVGDLEDAFVRTTGNLPDYAQVEGYFAYKRLMELDRTLRNIGVYRNKHRLGVELHNIVLFDKGRNRVESGFFDGIQQKEFPGGSDAILVLGKEPGKGTIYENASAIGTKNLEDVKEADPITGKQYVKTKGLRSKVRDGELKVIRIYDPEAQPLKAFFPKVGDKRIRYVITENVETKNIPFEQVPRRGGGHFEYEYDFYIKQAKMRPERWGKKFTHWYEGDVTVMPVMLRALGTDVADKLNNIRILLKANKFDEAKKYVKDNNLPMDYNEIRSWFYPQKVPNTKEPIPARLSLDEEIRLVPRDKSIIDIDKKLEEKYATTFRDGTRSGSDARQNQVAFTGERDTFDMRTWNNKGTKNNPLYHLEVAKRVDPISTMDRALGNIIQNHWLDDYKFYASEHWLKEATPYLKASESEIRYAPFKHFTNPEWKTENVINQDEVARLKAMHFQINSLLRTPSKMDTFLYSAFSRLADSLYEASPKWGMRMAHISPNYLIPFLKDPFGWARSITFHAKLGLFAVPQLLVQLQTFTNIFGLAGFKYAAPGAKASMLNRYFMYSNQSDEILNYLDGLASKSIFKDEARWKPGEFKESVKLLDRTGFANVGGEYALLDVNVTPGLVKGRGKDFLDWGTTFFREGERQARLGAWHTAYREFRDKIKPVGKITDEEIRGILNRADDLSANMSRASSSALHKGFMSLPAQFLTYQIRVAEQFLGKRLTFADRARMLTYYSAMYGVPVATTVTGIPSVDWFRKTAMDNGYIPGDNAAATAFMEGIPSLITTLITGNEYNIGDRFGPQGFETIREFLRGDKTIWDIAGGASFSTISGTLDNISPMIKFFRSTISGADPRYEVTVDDAVSIFKEVSSINTAWRTYLAINTGKWFSKKERHLVSDVTPMNAVFMALTGTSPQRAADLHLTAQMVKDRKQMWSEAMNLYAVEVRRFLRESDNGNHEQAQKYMARANFILDMFDFPMEKRHDAFRLAVQDQELADRIEWDYYTKDVPASKQEQFLETWQKRQLQGE